MLVVGPLIDGRLTAQRGDPCLDVPGWYANGYAFLWFSVGNICLLELSCKRLLARCHADRIPVDYHEKTDPLVPVRPQTAQLTWIPLADPLLCGTPAVRRNQNAGPLIESREYLDKEVSLLRILTEQDQPHPIRHRESPTILARPVQTP
jgi:hypothetical protein